MRGGRMHLDLWELNEKYGPIARVDPNTLVTSDPELLKRMLGVRTRYKRSNWYDAMRLDPLRDNVLSQRDDGKHNALRAKMAAGYSGKEVEGLEKKIDANIGELISLLERQYISTEETFKPVDMARKLQYLALDIIGDLAFGSAFGFLTRDSDVYEYIETTEAALPMILTISAFPPLVGVLHSPLLRRFLPSHKDLIGLGKIMGMAGSDTTATFMRAAFLNIITKPRVYATLMEEIERIDPSTPISDAEAREMPYLQALIKEGLRIHPPVTGLMAKEVPPEGDTFNGVYLPPGTKIGYGIWGLFRDRQIWGEDAVVFRPERWLEGSLEARREREATIDMVFNYGRWQCLGRNVALMELNKVFVELFRRFEFTLVDPLEPMKSFCVGIFTQSDMWVKVTRRS